MKILRTFVAAMETIAFVEPNGPLQEGRRAIVTSQDANDQDRTRPISMEINYRPIGVIHSPFDDVSDMPIQPAGEASAPGTAEVFEAFAAGLRDLDGFSHVFLVYHFHGVGRVDLMATPFLGSEPRGIFATRAPTRPNPIGLSVVRLLEIDGNLLRLADLDILDGTPLLDIKPYVPDFDRPTGVRAGWLQQQSRGKVKAARSDKRFD